MPDTAKVRALNDAFRTTFTGGRVVITRGVMALDDLPNILQQVREFSKFCPGNDPYNEHDFGAVTHLGEQIFWKIDYYDHDLQMGSENPADSSVTTRIITIMRADEY